MTLCPHVKRKQLRFARCLGARSEAQSVQSCCSQGLERKRPVASGWESVTESFRMNQVPGLVEHMHGEACMGRVQLLQRVFRTARDTAHGLLTPAAAGI